MALNVSTREYKVYGGNWVAMPLVLRGTGVASEMEVVAGPPGTLVAFGGGPFINGYTVQLPGNGRVSHIAATGHTNEWSGAQTFIHRMHYDPVQRQFSFEVADYSGGGAPIVYGAVANDIATFHVSVFNSTDNNS